MTQEPVSIGIIGAGIMGERMLNAILAQPEGAVALGGIWDPSPGALDRIAERYPAVSRLGDPAAVITASDCLYVASPPASHLGYARQALAAGKRFFGEKPLAVDLADARAFVSEAGGRGAVNFPLCLFARGRDPDTLDRRGRCRSPDEHSHRGRVRHLATLMAGRCGRLAGPP